MHTALEGIFEELGFDARRVQLPEGAAMYALARTYHLVMRRMASVYKRFGLSAASFNLLVLLQRGRDASSLTQQAAGERLVVSPSDMTGLVDRLERRGLVRRVPGKDRRSNLLRVTPAGCRLVEDVWPHHAQEMKRLAGRLSAQDTQALARIVSRLRQAA